MRTIRRTGERSTDIGERRIPIILSKGVIHIVFPESWLDDLRSRVDIVEIVSNYVTLKQKGHRYWACCPFHNEKSPSFSVDATQQMYYCFGCHKGGNVFTFLMEVERLDFGEAVRELADRAHFPLPEGNTAQKSISHEEKEQIYAVNKEAARFYHNTLWTPEGSEALSYLHKRGLQDSDIRHFGLGSTAKARNSCMQYLTKKGYSTDLLVKAGLCTERSNGVGDMFFHRVMFPIIDAHGNVLGFGGRVLDNGEPKYLNTGDTPVFNKRFNLFAMNFTHKERNLTRVILSEGYMDVIALRTAGVEGVVATLGTALTEDQARIMKRLAPQVWISYDGDKPGQKAALRALDIFEQMDIPAMVLDYPDGMDPDEYIRKFGAEGFSRLVPLTAAEYRMLRAKDGLGLSDEKTRTDYAIACCAILKRVKNPVERENYLKKLSIDTGFAREVLLEQIGVVRNSVPAAVTKPRTIGKGSTVFSEADRYEQIVITLLAQGKLPAGMVHEEYFKEGLHREIVKMLCSGVSAAAVTDRMDAENAAEITRMMNAEMLPEDPETVLQYAQDCIDRLSDMRKDRIYDQLLDEYSSGDIQKRNALHDQLVPQSDTRKDDSV